MLKALKLSRAKTDELLSRNINLDVISLIINLTITTTITGISFNKIWPNIWSPIKSLIPIIPIPIRTTNA